MLAFYVAVFITTINGFFLCTCSGRRQIAEGNPEDLYNDGCDLNILIRNTQTQNLRRYCLNIANSKLLVFSVIMLLYVCQSPDADILVGPTEARRFKSKGQDRNELHERENWCKACSVSVFRASSSPAQIHFRCQSCISMLPFLGCCQ